jgi:DNA-directed RNA polymerase specialized sigma24 family protein
MTSGVHDADDARLLSTVRSGDTSAFGVLYERHHQYARRLARDLVDSQPEADDVVAETFARVLDVVRAGGGPADGFRPYLLGAVRRVCYDRVRSQRTGAPAGPGGPLDPGEPLDPGGPFDPGEPLDPGEPFADPAATQHPVIVRAFRSLPERWSAVLWHSEIEQSRPSEVAPLFGLSDSGVITLRRRALDGLREAYLDLHVSRILWQECQPVAPLLGRYVRGGLSKHDTAHVAEHLDGCTDCRATSAELADIGAALRSQVTPAVLGEAAAAYLSGSRAAAAVTAGDPGEQGNDSSPGRGYAAAGGRRRRPAWHHQARLLPIVPRQLRGLLAGGGHFRHRRWLPAAAGLGFAALAVGAVAITLAASASPQHGAAAPSAGSSGTHQATSASPRATPSGKTSTKPRSAHRRAARRTSPSPSATPLTSTARLSAAVDVYDAGHHGSLVEVAFSASDTGTAATGELIASVTLPAGGSLSAGHGTPSSDGWACQQSSSGATCQHASIKPGQRLQGTVYLSVPTAACGEHVQVLVSAGTASATAQSPEDIVCPGGA